MKRAATGAEAMADLAFTAATMPAAEALRRLTYCEIGVDPAIPLLALLSRREELEETLLAELSLTADELEARVEAEPDERHAYFLQTIALYALAEWQEPRAFDRLVHYLGQDSETAAEQLGDIVTEDLHTILGRTYGGGDLGALKAIIENAEAEPFVRNACLLSLHVMMLLGKLPRADLLAYYAHVAETLKGPDNEHWADLIVLSLARLREPALAAAIEAWFEAGLVDEGYADRSEVARIHADRSGCIEEDLLRPSVFDNLTGYLCGWDWFNSTDPAEFSGPAQSSDDDEREPGQPYVREARKIGRNEPCPCGSGKKYKKCCLIEE
jgi:hypothetical protein